MRSFDPADDLVGGCFRARAQDRVVCEVNDSEFLE
jgi:hypothetical protein